MPQKLSLRRFGDVSEIATDTQTQKPNWGRLVFLINAELDKENY